MPHDIIDNRHGVLLDHIQRILPGCASAKFAVGYFFLSGLEAMPTNWLTSRGYAC